MSKQKYPQVATSATTGKPTRSNRRDNYSSVKLHAKRDKKRAEAYSRNEKYERMTLSEQLKSCIPGGSKRQRARIEAAMAKAMEKNPPSVKITAPIVVPVATEPVTVTKPKRTSKSKVVKAAKAERPSKS